MFQSKLNVEPLNPGSKKTPRLIRWSGGRFFTRAPPGGRQRPVWSKKKLMNVQHRTSNI